MAGWEKILQQSGVRRNGSEGRIDTVDIDILGGRSAAPPTAVVWHSGFPLIDSLALDMTALLNDVCKMTSLVRRECDWSTMVMAKSDWLAEAWLFVASFDFVITLATKSTQAICCIMIFPPNHTIAWTMEFNTDLKVKQEQKALWHTITIRRTRKIAKSFYWLSRIPANISL